MRSKGGRGCAIGLMEKVDVEVDAEERSPHKDFMPRYLVRN